MINIPSLLAGIMVAFAFYHGVYLYFKDKKYDDDSFSQLGEKLPKWLKRTISIIITLFLVVMMSYAVVMMADFKDDFDKLGCAGYCKKIMSYGGIGGNYSPQMQGFIPFNSTNFTLSLTPMPNPPQ